MVHPSLEARQKPKRKLKRKCLNEQLPAKKPAKVIHQVVHTSSGSSSGEARGKGDSGRESGGEYNEMPAKPLSTYDVGNLEFDSAFDLTNFPVGLRDKMMAVAPVLGGRSAEYNDEFFRDCVGLSDEGPLVDEVPKVYTFILEADIHAVWCPGSQPNWHEIAKCTDAEQVRLFSQHNFKVYGNRPDNAYFAMRFLKAAYATFVHGKPINWVAEAQRRRSRQISRATKNPRKTGPVALRVQMEGLCGIILNLATRTPARRMMRTIEGAQRDLDAARRAHAAASKVLLETQKKYDAVKDAMATCSDEEYGKLEAQNTAASEEQKRLYRTGTPSEFKAAAEVAQGISEKLIKLQEVQMTARATLSELEAGPLEKAYVDEQQASQDVVAAEATLLKAKRESLVLRPRQVFEHPIGQSVPVIESNVGGLCPMCSRGFVAKAAVLGSCGCLFYNVCVAQMIDANHRVCPACTSSLDAAWVAQWDGQADENQELEIEATIAKLKNCTVDRTNHGASATKSKLKGASLLSQFEATTPTVEGVSMPPDCDALGADPAVSTVMFESEPDANDPVLLEADGSSAAAENVAEQAIVAENATMVE